MATIFFTGFPGFLGSELIPRVLARDPEAHVVCLVQGKYADLARRRGELLALAHPELENRIEIIEGDITRPGLGMKTNSGINGGITEIYHLAAVYDLSVGRDFAMRVNVDGTRHMLEFAETCPALRRFQYVSTCYVSGKHPGVFSEDDLDAGQSFNNFYEETKFLAEVEVQQRMRAGLPVSIYRPAVVVGDSTTGATQKYDGPYFAMQFLLRQPRLAFMPVIGDTRKTELNFVPRDFVVNAIAFLSHTPESRGRVFHLADPNPLTVGQILNELGRITERKIIRVPVPLALAKIAIRHMPAVDGLIRIPADALDYFVHPVRYATARTQAALRGSGIRCPRFPEYAGILVKFMRAHPEIGSAAMV